MKRIPIDPAAAESFDLPLFVGDVQRQTFVDLPDTGAEVESSTVRVQLVRFSAGAHTRLHAHATDQVLVVTEGEGLVGTRDVHLVAHPGDVIHVPAGEPHYHGATPDTAMAHLSVLTPGALAIVDDDWTWPGTRG